MRLGRKTSWVGLVCTLILFGCGSSSPPSEPPDAEALDVPQSVDIQVETDAPIDSSVVLDAEPIDSSPQPVDLPAANDTVPEPDVPEVVLEHCEGLGFPQIAFNTEGPFGIFRHNLVEDFTFYPLNGDPWVLSENWTGCDTLSLIHI